MSYADFLFSYSFPIIERYMSNYVFSSIKPDFAMQNE